MIMGDNGSKFGSKVKISERDQISLKGEALKSLLKEVMKRGKRFRFETKGFSMQPFVRNGDVLTLAPLSGRKIQIGDIVACEEPVLGKLIVHRVIRKTKKGYLVKGDNSYKADGCVQRDSIYGRVVRIERKGKTVSFSLGPGKYVIASISRDLIGRRIFCYFWHLVWLLRRGFVKKGHL